MTKQLGAKVYLHEIKTVTRFWSFGDEVCNSTTERYLFATAEKMGHNMDRILCDLDVFKDTYSWNYMGDEYKVDPDYARACQLYESFKDDYNLNNLMATYGINIKIPEALDWEDWNSPDQAKTKLHQKTFEGLLDKLQSKMYESLPLNGFKIRIDNYPNYVEHKLTVVDLATDFLHAPGVVLDENSNDRANKEYEKYINSEQYEIDRKEEARLRSERATYMGENGFSSFSSDGENTYFW